MFPIGQAYKSLHLHGLVIVQIRKSYKVFGKFVMARKKLDLLIGKVRGRIYLIALVVMTENPEPPGSAAGRPSIMCSVLVATQYGLLCSQKASKW